MQTSPTLSSGMADAEYTDEELTAFLDEALAAERSAAIERDLRDDTALQQRLADVRDRDAAGQHSLGAIWRRARLSCPTRDELADHLAGNLPDDHSRFIAVHLDVVGCRYCRANADDLSADT